MEESLKEELFDKIKIFKPQPKDIITLYFDTDSNVFGIDDICHIADYLIEKYPQNTVVTLPNNASLKLLDVDMLKNYVKNVQEVINIMECENE
jgi:hypothetical protein